MPRGQPFTQLCQQLAQANQPVRADLHLHSTASDGDYTASQLMALAVQAQLKCIAITDHDCWVKVDPPPGLAVVPAVEFSTIWNEREWHVLGYWFGKETRSLTVAALETHLDHICNKRRERFQLYLQQFAKRFAIPDGVAEIVQQKSQSLGRRHLAKLLVQIGAAKNRHDAFVNWIHPAAEQVPAMHLTPLKSILQLIHDTGGIASLAHPPQDISAETLIELQKLGLDAVETRYPVALRSTTTKLEQFAKNLGLGISGGSDCHGPDQPTRTVGSFGLNPVELDRLRQICGSG